MILEAEIRRLAARWRVDPMILDLDYSLGWFLAGLYSIQDANQKLCFKGGTCLRKCYFPGYRFSEDLDFTAIGKITPEILTRWVERVARWSVEHDGPDFLAAPFRFEIVKDEYGKETYQIRVYFRGPLRWGGSPRVIQLDISHNEQVISPMVSRSIIHPYSDVDEFSVIHVACYSLLETLSEKIRAVCGQRRFAISRDIYDIYRLVQTGLLASELITLLPEKFKTHDVDITLLDTSYLESRRADYELDWKRRLNFLIPDSEVVSFEEAWLTTRDLIRHVQDLLNRSD